MKGQRKDPRLGQQSRGRERDWLPEARGRQGNDQRSVLEDNLLAVRTLVMGDMAADMDPPDTVLSVLFIIPSACPTASSCTPCGLQESQIWATGSFINQDVQCLLEDPSLREFHLQKASNPQLLPSALDPQRFPEAPVGSPPALKAVRLVFFPSAQSLGMLFHLGSSAHLPLSQGLL